MMSKVFTIKIKMMKQLTLLFLLLSSLPLKAMEIRFTLTENAAEALEKIKEISGIKHPFAVHVTLSLPKQESLEEQLGSLSLGSGLSLSGEQAQLPSFVICGDEHFQMDQDTLEIDTSVVKMTYIKIEFTPAIGLEDIPLPATGMFMLLGSDRHFKIDFSSAQGFFYN